MRPVRLWIGLMLLLGGLLGCLDALGVADGWALIGRWWPVAVIGVGLAAMLAQRHVSPGPVAVVVAGLLLLAGRQQWGAEGFVVPVALIVVGLAVISGRRSVDRTGQEASAIAIFGGSTVQDRSDHFRHADVSAVFGGATLDLRQAHLDDGASVDAFAMFGGVDVLVPQGWRITLTGLPIFGGYEDKTTGDGALPPDAPILTVNATAMFGGVSVAHQRS